MFKRDVAKVLAKSTKLKQEIILNLLEKPRYSNLGDIAFPCFFLAKTMKKSPNIIAGELAHDLIPPKGIDKIQAIGSYVNFFIDKKEMGNLVIPEILKKAKKYGSTPIGKGKKAIVEFSSPNIAKPMSIGHLRSTLIGHSLSRILAFQGYKTININYPGDYGTQFGKLLVAYRKWGKVAEKDMKKDPIKTMLKLYIKFTQESEKNPKLIEEARDMFKRLEADDPWATKLWKRFRELSLKEFQEFYDLFGIKFDVYSGESLFKKRAKGVIQELLDKKLAVKSAGALIVKFKDIETPMLVRKTDGTTLYGTRDIAAAIARYKQYKFDKMLYVVASEQNLPFKQLFTALKMMGNKWADRCYHVNFGMIYMPGGEKLSTRKGNVIFLEEVLNEIFKLTRKFVEKTEYSEAEKDKIAKAVGISALVYGDLSNDKIKDIKFDWNVLLRLEGDSGPYLQYTYARAKSILRKLEKVTPKFNPKDLAPEEESLIITLSEFPAVVRDSAEKLMPNLIANYILKLADEFNLFYEKHSVMNSKSNTKTTRAALTASTAQVLYNGMYLLGMIPLERM